MITFHSVMLGFPDKWKIPGISCFKQTRNVVGRYKSRNDLKWIFTPHEVWRISVWNYAWWAENKNNRQASSPAVQKNEQTIAWNNFSFHSRYIEATKVRQRLSSLKLLRKTHKIKNENKITHQDCQFWKKDSPELKDNYEVKNVKSEASPLSLLQLNLLLTSLFLSKTESLRNNLSFVAKSLFGKPFHEFFKASLLTVKSFYLGTKVRLSCLSCDKENHELPGSINYVYSSFPQSKRRNFLPRETKCLMEGRKSLMTYN